MFANRLIAAVFGLLLISVPVMAQDEGKLPPFERKVEDPSKPQHKAGDNDSDRHEQQELPQLSDSNSDSLCDQVQGVGNFFACLGIELFVKPVLLSPFWLPHLAVGDSFDRQPTMAAYPFADSLPGRSVDHGRDWSFRAGFAEHWVRGGPHGQRGEFSLFTSSRLGLDASFTHYHERINDGENILEFGEVLPTFAFAQSEQWDLRAGAGYQWIDGVSHHDRGKFAYHIRRFARPWQFACDLGASFGSGRPLWEVTPAISYHWNRFELRAAYRTLIISDLTLDGPEVGLAIWF